MQHQINFRGIFATYHRPLAHSEDLLGTTNYIDTDWELYAYFGIYNNKPCVSFKIVDDPFSSNPITLFETNDYTALVKWLEEHTSEIQSQINKKAEEWIVEHKSFLDNPFSNH